MKLLGTQKTIPQSPKLCRAEHVETRKESETAWEPQSNFLLHLIFLPIPAHRGALLCSFRLYRKTRFAKKRKKKREQKDSIAFHPFLEIPLTRRTKQVSEEGRQWCSHIWTSVTGHQLFSRFIWFLWRSCANPPFPQLLTFLHSSPVRGLSPGVSQDYWVTALPWSPVQDNKLADFCPSAFCSAILQREVGDSTSDLQIIREPHPYTLSSLKTRAWMRWMGETTHPFNVQWKWPIITSGTQFQISERLHHGEHTEGQALYLDVWLAEIYTKKTVQVRTQRTQRTLAARYGIIWYGI